MELKVFVGWDSREDIAYQVARSSILRHASVPVTITPIKLPDLVEHGLYTREIDPLASTEFTYSRFFVPYLAGYEGWALFCDCDFLFFADVAELMDHADDSKAVACVQHDYRPTETTKMDGQQQTVYPRKNWSSFMFFNCAHPSAKRLTIDAVNSQTGAYLHRMQWADDSEIAELPTGWNWLEGWHSLDTAGPPKAVHFTRGGPWFKDYQDVDYAAEWIEEANSHGWAGPGS